MQKARGKRPVSRYAVLTAGAFTALGAGAIYMWSIFNRPLMDMFGYTTAEVSLAYSLYELCNLLGTLLAGWLQGRMKSHQVMLAGGIVFGAGWIAAGYSGSLISLYLSFCLLGGTGSGILYNTIISVVMQWFPDRRGLANGICIGAIGFSAFIFAPLGNMLIESFDVQSAFRIVGLIWIAVYLAFSWLLVTPPAGWLPDGMRGGAPVAGGQGDQDIQGGRGMPAAAEAGASKPAVRDYTTAEMLRTPLYYLLVLTFLVGVMSGHMISGHASNIVQGLAGLSPAEGAIAISAVAVGSTAGRFGFGAVSDRIGRTTTLLAIFTLNAVTMLVFLPLSTSFAPLLASVCLVGACFGGILTVLPAMVGNCYGSAHFGQNYPLVYAGQTISTFIGPITAATAVESTGSYLPAFAIAGALSIAGIALTLACRHFDRKLATR